MHWKCLCKLSKKYLTHFRFNFALFSRHRLETFDISHAFLPLTIAKLATLKSVRFFGPPYVCTLCAILSSYTAARQYNLINLVDNTAMSTRIQVEYCHLVSACQRPADTCMEHCRLRRSINRMYITYCPSSSSSRIISVSIGATKINDWCWFYFSPRRA